MVSIIERFPFLGAGQIMVLARVATAIFFLAHAIGRIIFGTIPQFGAFMESAGFPHGMLVVWFITLCEIICSLLLIFGRYVRMAVIPLLAIVVGGIALIHASQGWFVGEHGTGGSEYSVALIILLLVVASVDRDSSRRVI